MVGKILAVASMGEHRNKNKYAVWVVEQKNPLLVNWCQGSHNNRFS